MAAVFRVTIQRPFLEWKCIILDLDFTEVKSVPNGPINNIPALIQKMVLCRPGDKPSSELMIVSLLIYLYMRY